MESNESPEIPDRGETSDIPSLPSGGEREGGKGREREKKEREGGRGKEAEAGRQTHMFIKLGAMHTLELSKLLLHELQ